MISQTESIAHSKAQRKERARPAYAGSREKLIWPFIKSAS